MSDLILELEEEQPLVVTIAEDSALEVSVAEQIVIGGAANLQSKSVSYTPTESAQSAQVTADEGYDGLSEVDISVGAISDTYVGTAIPRNDSDDLTASGKTVTVPTGYYENQATKDVQTGTEGTPTATKGAVSNHSVDITPSVTNSEGYINGGTKTGTAVSVSASELVSGTKSITQNGVENVTNYEYVNVVVPSGSPTLQNKTVYPSSSDQSITADNGYDGLGTVTAKGVLLTNLTAANIVSGVTVKVGDADDDDRVASVTGTARGGGVNTSIKFNNFVMPSQKWCMKSCVPNLVKTGGCVHLIYTLTENTDTSNDKAIICFGYGGMSSWSPGTSNPSIYINVGKGTSGLGMYFRGVGNVSESLTGYADLNGRLNLKFYSNKYVDVNTNTEYNYSTGGQDCMTALANKNYLSIACNQSSPLTGAVVEYFAVEES